MPAASPVRVGGVALPARQEFEHTRTCASDNRIEPPRARLLTAAFAAQLSRPRYEPETFTEPEPILNVPEKTTVTEPVGLGHSSCVSTPLNTGGVAFSPSTGCMHTAACASDNTTAALRGRLLTAAFTAQLFAPR